MAIVTQVVVQTPAPPAPPADFNLIAMQLTDIVAAVLVFAGVMLVARWLLRSPIAEAIGARIRAARGGEAVSGEHEDRVARLEAEVSSLRHELTEYAERLDFAERLLAERRRDKLGAGS